jgi:hypothetical protein
MYRSPFQVHKQTEMVGRGSGSLGSDVIVIFGNFSPYDFQLD